MSRMPTPPSTIDFPVPPVQNPPGGDPESPPFSAPQDYFTPDQKAAPYRVWLRTKRWVYDSGLVQQAIAGPDGTPAKIVRLRAATGLLVVRYLVIRDGAEPVLPDPNPAPGDTNFQLLRYRIVPTDPTPLPDGRNFRFEVRARYVYALLTPLTTAQGLPGGMGPYATLPAGSYVLGPDNFSQQYR
jgi:hypothetical protein